MSEEGVVMNLQYALPRNADERSKEIFELLELIIHAEEPFDAAGAADEIDVQCLGSNTDNPLSWDAEVEDYVSRLWVLMMSMMERVPANHPGQMRMIRTIVALQRIDSGDYQVDGKRVDLWKDLPMLKPCTGSPERNGTTVTLIPDRDVIPEEGWRWVNVNSFAAKIYGMGLMNKEWLGFVVSMMTTALEVPDHPQEVLEVYLCMVHQWVELAGDRIYLALTGELSDEERREVMICGPLYDGHPSRPKSRWHSWKGRLVGLRLDVQGKIRSMTMRTSLEMGRVEVRLS